MEKFDLHTFIIESNTIHRLRDFQRNFIPAEKPGNLLYDNCQKAYEYIEFIAHDSEPIPDNLALTIHGILINGFNFINQENKYRNSYIDITRKFECPFPQDVELLMHEAYYPFLHRLDLEDSEIVSHIWDAHYMFEIIHPFSDMNGLVSLFITNYLLLRFYEQPIIVFSENVNEYYNCIEKYYQEEGKEFLVWVLEKHNSNKYLKEKELI